MKQVVLAALTGIRRRFTTPVLSVGNNADSPHTSVTHHRLQQMLGASPTVIYTTEAAGAYACTFVSDNLRSIFGYAPDEMVTDPKHWPGNLHPQDAAQIIDRVTALIECGGGTVEYRFRHRDGRYIWVQDTFKVICDAKGDPIELVGAWADISERRLAEDLLQKAYNELEKRVDKRTEELRAGRQRLEYVLATSPAITYATQATGDFRCTFASESSRQIMGYEPAEALADSEFWIKRVHPKDAPQVLADFARLIPQGQGNLEYRFMHSNGYYRWFQDTFQVVSGPDGKPFEIVGSWADVTHRKLGEAVRELYAASLERHEPLTLKGLDSILETGREVFNLDRLTILRADVKQEWLQAIIATGADEPLNNIRVPTGIEGGALAKTLRTKQTIIWDGRAPLPEELRLLPPYDQIKSLRSRVFAVIPLILNGQAIGVIAADRKVNRIPFEPSTLEALERLASQAALALEHSRLFAAAQPILGRSLQLSEVYPAFARAVKALLPYDRMGVVVPQDRHLIMALSVAEPPLATWQGASWEQSEGTAVDWVLKNAQPYIVRDTQTEQPFLDSAFVAKEGVRSSMMVPLVAGGASTGVFFLDSVTPSAYTEQDLELIEPVAQQLALAIDNTRLFHEIEEKSRKLTRSLGEMEVLRDVSNALNSTLDLQTVLETIVADAVQLSSADGGAIYESDDASKSLNLVATHGLDEGLAAALRDEPVRYGEGSVGHAASTRAPFDVPDVEDSSYEMRLRSVVSQAGYRAILSVPLVRDGRVFGGLSLFRRSTGKAASETIELLKMFATQSMLAIQNARQFQEIQDKSRQLEIANSHKSQFLAHVSHELRTPLNAILGYTELILDNVYGETSDKIRSTLSRVEKNGRHLLSLINDVLDLSKIEAGEFRLADAAYSMTEAVRAAVLAIEPMAKEKKLEMKIDVPPGLPLTRGDERRTTQVCLNLLGNAVKFTDAGEISLSVSIVDGSFKISLSDTGPGIPPEDQERIFEEFQQGESAASPTGKGGTGLGLAISKRIVEMQGGKIGMTSVPGEGSTFWFTLPVRSAQSEDA